MKGANDKLFYPVLYFQRDVVVVKTHISQLVGVGSILLLGHNKHFKNDVCAFPALRSLQKGLVGKKTGQVHLLRPRERYLKVS